MAVRILAISPFLNEAELLPEFLRSIEAQTRPPDSLLLVDDGSSDDSYEIASRFAEEHGFASALRRPPRPSQRDRLAGAEEYRAFQWALGQASDSWDVVAKLDGDLKLTPRTLETIERELEADPGLGLAGAFLSEFGEDGRLARLRTRPEHVHGATKFYRSECYEAISPMRPILGWDMFDEIKAQIAGWRTQSFAMPEGDPLHMRMRGGHAGKLRSFRRWGEGAWAMGEHPLHVVLVGAQRTRERPWVIGGLNYVLGWARAAIRRLPRVEPEVRRVVRRGQLRRIRRRLSSFGAREQTSAPNA